MDRGAPRIVIIIIISWLCAGVVYGAGPSLDVADIHFKNISDSVGYKRLKTLGLPVSEIDDGVWEFQEGSMLSFGYTDDTLVLNISLENSSSDLVERVLSVDFPHIDSIAIYENGDYRTTTGDTVPFSKRPIRGYAHGILLKFNPFERKNIKFVINSQGGVQLPITLSDKQYFLDRESGTLGLMGLMFGFIVSISLISFFSWRIYKDNALFLVGLLSLSAIVFLGCYYQLYYRYIWPENPVIHRSSVIVSLTFFSVCFVLFVNHVISSNSPNIATKLFGRTTLIGAVSVLLTYQLFSYQVALIVAFCISVPLFVGSIIFVNKVRRSHPIFGMYYIVAWALCSTGCVLTSLSELGYSNNSAQVHSMTLGLVCMLALFFLMLVHRFSVESNEKLLHMESVKNLQIRDLQKRKQAAFGGLIGGLKHEMRTPLSTINSTLRSIRNRIMKREPFDDYFMNEVMDAAFRSVKRMGVLLNELSAMSENGSTAAFEDHNLEEILRGLSSAVPELKHVDFRVKADGVMIFGSLGLIGQCFINLANNSIYALQGTQNPIIDVLCSEDDNYTTIVWEDNGTGMDESTLNRLFDPFYTTKPVGVGSGLGMSNVQSIVVMHNGLIDVSSSPNVFSRFTIKIPKHQPAT